MWRWLFLIWMAGCATQQATYSARCCCEPPTPLAAAVAMAVGGLVNALAQQSEPPPRSHVGPGVQRYRGRVTARMLIPGGTMELIGLPPHSRDEVVLAVRPIARLQQECAPALYRDGEPLRIGEQVRRSDHELWLTLPVDQLSARWQFAGDVCGASFELDAEGRDKITDFVARFQQRVSGESPRPVARTVEQVTQRHVAVAD